MATKRQLQAQQTKQKILDTAQRLIAERGYDNVTIRDIATESQIGLGTMYHYFSKKEDLILFNDRERFLELHTRTKEANDLSSLEKLQLFIENWFEYVASDNVNYSRHWHKMAVSLCATESADGKNRLEQDIAYIVDFLNSAVSDKELRDDIPANDIAMDIVFSMYGASLGRCMAHQDIDLNDWAERFLKQILPLHLDPYRI